MITIDVAVQVAFVSVFVSGLFTLVARLLSRNLEKSQGENHRSEAAKALSEAAQLQIKTYNSEVVTPLTNRIDSLEDENKSLRLLLVDSQERYEVLRRAGSEQVEALQLQIKNLAASVNSQRDQILILIEQGQNKDVTIQRMQVEIDQLKRENQVLKAEVEKLRSENDALKTLPTGGMNE